MYFHAALVAAPAPHTLEWPWRATWVCAENSAHWQIAEDSELRQLRRVAKRESPEEILRRRDE
jgi:hypothetical protein